MGVQSFIDTNVIVHALDGSDERKARLAHDLIRNGLMRGTACISFQVVQECLNTILRKAAVPLDADSARRVLDTVLLPLLRVHSSAALYRSGLEVQSRWGFGFYDALIVAAALEAGCDRLYTEDLQHGQVLGRLTVVNPFA